MLVWILIAVAVLAVAAVLIKEKIKRGKQGGDGKKNAFSSSQFNHKMAEAGFTPQEAASLLELAIAENIENPTEILWAYKSLDTVIKSLMQKFLVHENEKDADNQEFLGKLLDRRKQLTVQRLNMRKKLINSGGIPVGQEVKVVLVDRGIFTTTVMPHDFYFAVLSPVIFDLPPDFKWENRKVMIFFRKKNDGEYSFNTTVIKEIADPGTGEFVLLLQHQKILFHTQKRQSVRVLLNKRAHIHPVGSGAEQNFAESKPCTLYDISDNGCSVIMDGKMNAARPVIIQIMLGGQLIGFTGECLSVQYNKEKNKSMLHIRASTMPREVRNIILAVMFGLISNDGEPPVLAAVPENDTKNAKPPSQPNTVSDPKKSATDDQTPESATPQPATEPPAE
ncbi:MAG: PilZ domain-containing protein [Spirochaetaceae bacterium]|nr:PilZ domain-containing protein [Spirochaetaceae bacterium]